MNKETKALIRAIKYMNFREEEHLFYELKELFIPEVSCPEVVNCFKLEYDEEFKFTGTASGLYHAIRKWISDNIG